jgi:16S rRNA (cytidine1402-2'-O)-methyltransferase
VLAALAASGLPTDAFHFAGFLPARPAQRRKLLARLNSEPATLIFYEAPHRIRESLEDIEAVLGERPIVLAREITKLHEEFLRGTAAELRSSHGNFKGEMTLLIGKATAIPVNEDVPVPEAVDACIRAGMTRMEAMKSVARARGLSKRDVYKILEQE